MPPAGQRECLGSGSYASAYATEDGRVVKITSDISERYAALLVMRTPHRNLVRVDHVFAYGSQTVIVVERLGRRTGLWYASHSGIVKHAQLGPARREIWNEDRGFHVDWAPTWQCSLSHGLPPDERFLLFLEGTANGLLAAGVLSCTDLHQGNVMTRESTGDLVLSDLGCTTSSSQPEPAELPQLGISDGDDGGVQWVPGPGSTLAPGARVTASPDPPGPCIPM